MYNIGLLKRIRLQRRLYGIINLLSGSWFYFLTYYSTYPLIQLSTKVHYQPSDRYIYVPRVSGRYF